MGFFTLLFSILDQKRIPYAVLRNYDDLPEKPLKGSDVDLLIDTGNKDKYLNILKEVARKSDSYVILKLPQVDCISCFVYQKNSSLGFWIDACTELSTKSFVWADSKFLLKNRRKNEKDFFVIPPGGEAATIFVKEFLSHSEIKKRYDLKIPYLAKNNKDAFIKTLRPYFKGKTVEEMFKICSDGKWNKASKKRKGWFLQLIVKDFLRQPFYQLFHLVEFIYRHIKKNFSFKGITIAFIGPDGVGKTTVCEKIPKRTGKIYFKKNYQYHGHFGFFPEWGNMYKRIFGKKRAQKIKENRRNEKAGFLYSVFSVLYYGLEYFISWPWVIWKKMRGNLLIFDRYFYDFAAMNTSSGIPLWLFWNIAKFIPRPNLVFIMLARPELIYKRKKELSLKEIERQIKAFRSDKIYKLAPATIIDGEKSTESVLNEVEDKILKILSRKIK
ncbi:hypothetical protein ACFLYY_02625 [Patescibacteria group bacterium]